MVGGNFKGFFHALSDSDGRNNNNELTPAVFFIQLEHRLDINIGLTGTSLHFNIKAAPAQIFHKIWRLFDVVLALYLLNIHQQLIVRQFYHFVFIADIIVI